jgi:hypothetical protein
MNKFKGPDLKMPDLKMPAFVTDLYLDLRERRLLPLVALVLIAIVAVPFLLSSGTKPKPVPVAPAPPAASNASELTVVQATPGLRDYRKRLRGRTPTDPFKQHEASVNLSGTKLGSKGDNGFESNEVTSSTTTTTSNGSSTVTKKTTETPHSETTTTTTETETETGDSNGSSPPPGQISLYSFAIDVKITRTATKPNGSKETSEPEVRHEVVAPATLPSEKVQAVTYLGISPKTRNPLLLISDSVTSIFGEGKCISGESKCQLLEVETGFPITFVVGPSEVRYKINIIKVEPVIRGHF